MDSAVVLVLCALIFNILLAGPRAWYAASGLPHLSRLPAGILRNFERKLNREHRGAKALELRGTVVTAGVLALAVIGGIVLHFCFKGNLRFFEMLILFVALPVRPTWDCVSQIQKSLRVGDLPAARTALEGTAWRHHAMMDDHAVARAGVEMLAVHFSEKILAPVLYYLLFGLPGLFVSKITYLMQETLAHHGQARHQGFGRTATRIHYVLNFIPSRMAVVLWMMALLFMPAAKPSDAVNQITSVALDAPPQVISVLAAAATLGLSLGGPASIYAEAGWIGSGQARVTSADVKRAMYSYALLNLFLLAMFGFFL